MSPAAQDLASLKLEELTPLTPEVISRQATFNIGDRSSSPNPHRPGAMTPPTCTVSPSQASHLFSRPSAPQDAERACVATAGTIGHVAHGKSTVVKAISGVQTVRFKNELERNITIKLGYANAKIYRCKDPRCPRCVAERSRQSTRHPRYAHHSPHHQTTQQCCRHVAQITVRSIGMT